jgi:hypothetical protein
MKPAHHVIISGGVSAILAIWVKSPPAILACFLSGIFIDLDHYLDYYLERKELPLSYRKLVDFCNNDHKSKLRLPLHSYELLLLLWISVFYFSLGVFWVGVAIGLTTHIICDEIFNPLRPLSYFLIYRIRHGFNRKMIFKKGYFNEIS